MTEKISPEIPITRSVAILIIMNRKVLLVRHEEGAGHLTGVYGLPAGRPDFEEEEDLDIAVRELEQETGLIARREDLEGFPDSYYEAEIPRKDGSIIRASMQVYVANNFSGELKPNEETTPEWKTFKEVKLLDREGKLLPNVLKAVQTAKK